MERRSGEFGKGGGVGVAGGESEQQTNERANDREWNVWKKEAPFSRRRWNEGEMMEKLYDNLVLKVQSLERMAQDFRMLNFTHDAFSFFRLCRWDYNQAECY